MTPLLLPVLTIALAAAPQNPILAELTERGVCIEDDTFAKIKPPSMANGLDAAAQQEVISRVAGPRRRVADLVRESVVAPFVLDIEQVSPGEGKPPMRSVDVWFVAYGQLEQFTSKESLEEFADRAVADNKSRLPFVKGVLDEAQMRARGLRAEESENQSEHYFYSTFGRVDRVHLSATRRIVVTRGPESVLVAAMIDPRFTTDAEFPNQWRPAESDKLGEIKLGLAHRYESAGFYAKVTRLAEPQGALFIEYHQLFCEPVEWFDGANLLRSKLPMMAQDAVRKLRRKLRESSEK